MSRAGFNLVKMGIVRLFITPDEDEGDVPLPLPELTIENSAAFDRIAKYNAELASDRRLRETASRKNRKRGGGWIIRAESPND